MYIPMVEIPGCRPGYRNDNRGTGHPPEMQTAAENEPNPRETVAIHFSSLLPTYEAAAEFYSYIAYLDPADATQREKYRIALSRWDVLARGKLDKAWNESEQKIRPTIFLQPEKLFLDSYRGGSLIWWRRAQCAFMMLLPHLVDELFGGSSYTVGNIVAILAGHTFGYSDGSHKTVEFRIWAPTKAVAHAAAAVMLYFGMLSDPAYEWDDEHILCYKQQFLATLFYEDVFRDLLLVTALLRLQVPSCERFHIRENETI